MARINRAQSATGGPVLVIGTGLIGTSIALGLRSVGVPVYLWDTSPTSLALAADMGAGNAIATLEEGSLPEGVPTLVVVATPPDVAASMVVQALNLFPSAVVTDVASVKGTVATGVARALSHRGTSAADRYVGSHPMAGRENAGANNAHGDLFIGRPWVLSPTHASTPSAVAMVRDLAVDLGAVPLELEAEEHDRAVALVSHVPQLISSLLAARLADAPQESLALAGSGLRDMTRIASSEPRLWTAIVAGNAPQIREILEDLHRDLEDLLDALPPRGADVPTEAALGAATPGVAGAVCAVMARGNAGAQRIPGKHGEAAGRWGYVEVLVPDEPGQLGRLFTELGAVGVNMEDLVLEHSAAQPVGLARVMVDSASVEVAARELAARGWRVASHSSKGAW